MQAKLITKLNQPIELVQFPQNCNTCFNNQNEITWIRWYAAPGCYFDYYTKVIKKKNLNRANVFKWHFESNLKYQQRSYSRKIFSKLKCLWNNTQHPTANIEKRSWELTSFYTLTTFKIFTCTFMLKLFA